MLFSSLFSLAAASAALASPMMDMRGLSRLSNTTLNERAIFPSGGFRGVNVGAWFVFGECKKFICANASSTSTLEPYMAVDEWHAMVSSFLFEYMFLDVDNVQRTNNTF